jgi:hypothetical protein
MTGIINRKGTYYYRQRIPSDQRIKGSALAFCLVSPLIPSRMPSESVGFSLRSEAQEAQVSRSPGRAGATATYTSALRHRL